jgi:hypothetical protein
MFSVNATLFQRESGVKLILSLERPNSVDETSSSGASGGVVSTIGQITCGEFCGAKDTFVSQIMYFG